MALAYCNDCYASGRCARHSPHGSNHRRRSGRHLAPKTAAPRPVRVAPRPAVLPKQPATAVSTPRHTLLETLGFTDRKLAVTDRRSTGNTLAPPVSTPTTTVPDIELDGWAPHVIARRKLAGARLRPSSAAGLVVLVGVAILAALILRNTDAQAAAEQQIASAVAALSESLHAVELVALPDGPGADADLAAATSALIGLERNARALFDVTASLPEGSEDRAGAASLAAAALDAGRTLGDAWTYQLALMPLWRMPELPAIGDATDQAAVLAAWQVELLGARQDVKAPPAFGEHLAEYDRLLDGFDDWRIGYLDALTAGNEQLAQTGVDQLSSRIDELRASLTDATGFLRENVAQLISGLRTQAATLGQ